MGAPAVVGGDDEQSLLEHACRLDGPDDPAYLGIGLCESRFRHVMLRAVLMLLAIGRFLAVHFFHTGRWRAKR
jgi:hypothetical protein